MNALAQTENAEIRPVANSADPMSAMIERIAMDPNIPMDRLTALLDMRERQMNKEAEQVFNQAFAAAMAEMPDVPRSGVNGHNKTKYSKLEDLIRTTRPVLSRHGLSLNWTSSITGNEITVTAIVRHAQGHQISTTLSGPKDSGKQMNALQAGGSTETYLKRYSGFSILGLSSGDEVDDDGRGHGKGETISADQFIELQGLIERAGITEEIVCKAEALDGLHELPKDKFNAVKSRLTTTIKGREAK